MDRTRNEEEHNARFDEMRIESEKQRMQELIQAANKKRADSYAAADAVAIVAYTEAIQAMKSTLQGPYEDHVRMLAIILSDTRKRAQGYANADAQEHEGRQQGSHSREQADKCYTLAVWDRPIIQ